MDALRPEQIEFFHEQGYLVLDEALDPAHLQPLVRELEAVVEVQARALREAGRLGEIFEDEPFDRRLACLGARLDDPSDLWRAVHGKHHKTAGMFTLLTAPALLDRVESLIGPEILAHPQFNLRAKLPRQQATVVPWHQDLGYLEPDAEGTFMINFWIPLVDAPMESGPLQVIPGSHRWDLLTHEQIDGYLGIPQAVLPPHAVVDCPLRAGGALMLQHKTVHRSLPNVSDRVRWSVDLRYSDPRQPTGRPRVPGFLARSRALPQAVARSHEDWLALFAAQAGGP